MSIFILYLLFVLLPNLQETANVAAITSAMLAIAICIIIRFGKIDNDMSDKTRAFLWHKARWSIGVFFVFGIVSMLAPNQEQIYTIAGAYAVTNDKELQKLPDNLLGAANNYLETLNKALEIKKPEKTKSKN